jgi:cell pole-organizing protein PopZ
MSASQTPPPGGNPADPSMEDILASIRRILSEDEVEHASPGVAAPAPKARAPVDDGVLSLDASMLVDEPPRAAAPPPPKPEPPPEPPAAKLPVPAEPPAPISLPDDALVAPEAAAAAASSVGALVRTLIAGREQIAVHRGGPTIEDLVREEIRPLLKEWLDTNLPPLVERLVRAEIERVVGRAVS